MCRNYQHCLMIKEDAAMSHVILITALCLIHGLSYMNALYLSNVTNHVMSFSCHQVMSSPYFAHVAVINPKETLNMYRPSHLWTLLVVRTESC